MSKKEIECPKCGKRTVFTEHPDEYELWLKCTECDFFLGMSADDWHRIHNSPNIDEKIRKMYGRDHAVSGKTCRFCGSSSGEQGVLGFCSSCCFKVLIIVLVIMIIGSYMVWMAVL